ncbi:MAG: L-glutamate gamma-semialdehyde dehydrogenase [Anaerolineae bacterium]|nr:MAG: L-glutamate gamma-semialdehyde dehydrogenase [Anaerolineae bacterium]
MAEKVNGDFRLTYATMYDPPEELHQNYEAALAEVRDALGAEHAMIISGKDEYADEKFEDRSPINQDWVLGSFQSGTEEDAHRALDAAQRAVPAWARMPWKERVETMRRAAAQIDARVYEIAAVLSLEVGKNRMEALADAAEAADLIRYACDQMESNDGYVVRMGKDPLKGYQVQNISVLRPYGVWVVISPFNFPAALTGGPAGAALVAGNTIVMKPATDTPWTVRLLAECFREAGLPDGAFNYVTGPGSTLGEALVNSPLVDGITFTGSFEVGMHIYRTFAAGQYPRPIILEMGGKNPSLITRNADLDRAVSGILRSAFGLQGQKCSANSRIYVEEQIHDELVSKLSEATKELKVGDPTDREVFMGPVINRGAYQDFKNFSEELSEAGEFLTGGKIITAGDLDKGFFVEPTIVAGVEEDHRLWKHEMFLPITMVHACKSKEEALELANSTSYGLTAGFYGSDEEAEWFFENIEAGVTYANRPQGSTTGAWPGFQPFGGWKGSGSSGKNAGGHYYLQLYMHEQVHTIIK